MDPLSDVLSLLKVRSYVAGGFDVGGAMSLRFGRHDGIKCYAVVSGECWLVMEGAADAMLLKAGDCFLMTQGRPFQLTTDLGVTPSEALPVLRSAPRQGGIGVIQGGGRYCLVGGHFSFMDGPAAVLLGMLPAVVPLRKESEKAVMRWSLEQMREELLEDQPGGALVAGHLAHMMLVQALRLHLTEGVKGGVGWLFALADPQMSGAMRAMHEEPGRKWTLEELGERVGMSRSMFALRFKQTVGSSPMEYLTRWRMLVAGDRLLSTRESLTEIAGGLGYCSESAFSTAFKRVMGCAPRQYGRRESGSVAAD